MHLCASDSTLKYEWVVRHLSQSHNFLSEIRLEMHNTASISSPASVWTGPRFGGKARTQALVETCPSFQREYNALPLFVPCATSL
ncbi:hypothetical protein PG991_013129 [Apiospora marii]|uniref:Uncharacterized protein n=1 Tax=Apiospora marii TaxID=335849 RepID=A0ABR1R594_9PEZI